MPHAEEIVKYKFIQVRPLHPTFGAEISGVDFSKPVPPDVFAEILDAMSKYSVLTFRSAHLTDTSHIAFSALFGPLDDITPYLAAGRTNRLAPHIHLFDVSNLNDDNTLVEFNTTRAAMNKGNTLFHVDSSFNPRRAGYSLLRAHRLPPRATGGDTEFADVRAAWADLDGELKAQLRQRDHVVQHSLWHSRRKAAPESDVLQAIDPDTRFVSRHKLVQTHEPSGRETMYIAAHAMRVEGMEEEASTALIERLLAHASQEKYRLKIEWEEDGDLLIWDNTAVMHRAVPGGAFEGKYVRDMRRTTVHDESPWAWGLNEKSDVRVGMP